MMIKQVDNILNYSILTFNGHAITPLELLTIPIWIIISLLFFRFLIKKLGKNLTSRKKDPNLIHLVERLLYAVSFAIIFITTLSMLNIPLTAFAFLSGAIAIGFGFGAQNIINNFISGWILMGEKPIRIGDFLEVEGVKGTVEEINTRSTRVRRVDGVHLLIPNSKLLENTVINWTLRDKLVRGTVLISVAYGSNCKQVADIMLAITQQQPEVIDAPKAAVFFQDFGDNALIFEVFFWINSQVDGGLRAVSSNIRFALDEEFNTQGIVVAYPQRDIHIDGAIKLVK